jgi:hypothetical protein
MSQRYLVEIVGKDKTGKAFKQVQGNVDKAKRSVLNLKNAIIAIGAGTVIRSIINTTARFQDLRTSLASVTGSAQSGAEAFRFITDIATKTQFSVEDLSRSFIKLKAAGITPSAEILNVFTNTAAITTDQIGTLEAVTDLFARTVSGGLGLEEIQRLGDRGVPVLRILEEQLGLTRSQISEFGKTAEGAKTIVDAFAKGIQDEFGDATANLLKNLNVQFSNLGIAITDAQDILGQGLAPVIADITVEFTDFINANQELIKQIGVNLGQALNDAIDLFVLASENIRIATVAVIALVGAFSPISAVILGTIAVVNLFRNSLEETLGTPLRLADVFKGTFAFVENILTSFIGKITNDFKEFINGTISLVNKLPFTEFALPFELAKESTDNANKSLGEYILEQTKLREEAEKTAKFFRQLSDQLQFQTFSPSKEGSQEEDITVVFSKEIKALQDKFRTETEIIEIERDKQLQLLDEFLEKEKNLNFDQLLEIGLLKEKIAKETDERLSAIEDKRLKNMKDNLDKQFQLIKDRKFAELDLENLTQNQMKDLTKKAGRELLDSVAQNNKKAFEIAKALDTAEAIMSTAKGVAKAIGSGNFILAGIIGALGAVQVAKIQSTQYQGRALGGPVRSGNQYMVGEQGPEMFVPNQSGSIIANKDLGRATTVNVNVYANDTEGFDNLLVKRRSVIVNVINDALNSQGKEALV